MRDWRGSRIDESLAPEFGNVIALAERLPLPGTPLKAAAADKLAADAEPPAHLLRLAVDALARIGDILQENAALAHRVVALEEQVQATLAERLSLTERLAALEGRLAALRAEHQVSQAVVRQLAERAGQIAGATPRAIPPDEEVLLSTLAATAPEGDDGSPVDLPAAVRGEHRHQALTASDQVGVSYVLVAFPFERFTDLGQFQAQVQRLSGVRNVRVRRFAQGVLEMRLDYRGSRSLVEVLHGLAGNIEAVEEEEPCRLQVRLRTGAH